MESNTSNEYFAKILGRDQVLEKQIERAKVAAKNNAPVLIVGETGTGKELFAKAIHFDGLRKSGPYVGENCAAVPETLAEGVFFGTEKGGFTEAISRKGLFEQAEGGTLLLDELNSMSLYIQTKLLRVLQEEYIRRIGGTKEIIIDARIIATVNEKPEVLIKQGILRQDLFYRLSVIRIDIPPLRERPNDIPIYVDAFFAEAKEKYGMKNLKLDITSLDSLKTKEFPGNVRQLKNMVDSAVAMAFENEAVEILYNDI